MTTTAQKAASEVNPLEQLQQNFSTFGNLYQAIINVLNSFPVDEVNKALIFHDFQAGFNHLEKYLNFIAQQMATPKIVGVEDAPKAEAVETAVASDPAEPVTAA